MIEFAQRRQHLFSQLPNNSLVILPTQPIALRNGDVKYPYRPNSYFYYLTGFPEARAVAILRKVAHKTEYILSCQANDYKQEQWHGRRIGLQRACSEFQADEAWPIEQLEQRVGELFSDIETIYYPFKQTEWHSRILTWLRTYQKRHARQQQLPNPALIDIEPVINEMRLLKSPHELNLMRQAVNISVEAHQHVMRFCRPGLTEYQLEAEFLSYIHHKGCRSVAYPSIVAAGNNGVILHYTENSALLQEGELVLIDAGAEYQYYAADITRTFPVTGKFTATQRALYEVVLQAQLTAISLMRPGTHWHTIQNQIVRQLTQGLVELGILKGRVSDLIEQKAYAEFYMHNFGHWLGLDVHDPGNYLGHQSRTLAAQMVLTIEPGIYIDKHNTKVPEEWRGMAIRIEDDVVITEQGCEILSAELPKTVADIEHWMAQ